MEKLHVRLGDSAGRRGQVNKESFTVQFSVYLHLHCPYPLAWVYKLVGSSAFSSFSAITTSTTIATAAVGSQVTTVRLPLQRNDMISCILRTANGLRPYRTRQSKARKCSSYRLY